ncbi:ABC transporter ATP-binding protein [Leptolyngbya sp. NIES-2104]|uniref:ABC transporter ATP-binding protein n=1 Tax=Leptolyngbya sp. NIES-2104 TaxID=1552121 RepID=UPI0006EC8D11|nr:ABC transporter ATP-binding protein [Leptolyngbya sp. NIES-2104]GAP94285.1 ABC transporter ATP-binding protein [Leptolyngbya sp. NIES-2104]
MSNAISIRNLTKQYGKLTVLKDLSLEVPHGSIFGFLGPNGAGKTTTIQILAGLSRATSGSASINGVPVTSAGLHRRHLGYIAQQPRFYGWMTGREVLEYAASFHPEKASKHRIDHLLERVGIAHARDRACRTYSGGMRQRLGIAQALIGQPAVLILDEPVSAMDAIGRAEVLELMRDLRGETTVFYSTHILEDVQRLSDFVAILNQGQLIATAPTEQLLNSFNRGSLRVTFSETNSQVAAALRRIPHVIDCSLIEQTENRAVYTVQAEENAVPQIQRAITHLASDRDLTLITNELIKLDLETVFLQLVDAHRNSPQFA